MDYQATLVGCQILVSAILYGTDDSRAGAERDPRVQAFRAELERLACVQATRRAAAGQDTPQAPDVPTS